MGRLLVAIAAVAACGLQDLGAGADFNFDGLTGEVFACEANVGAVRMTFEFCWKDGDASALEDSLDRLYDAATCEPTPRHLGPCIYGCSPHTGCNAINGCWCP